MAIDFHAHIYHDDEAAKAISAIEQLMDIEVPGRGTVSDLQNSMHRSSLKYSVLLPVARLPEQVKEVNDHHLQVANEELITFGAAHPFMPDLEEELDRLEEAGVKGIKVVPFLQQFYPDHPNCEPFYESLMERGMVLLLHAGKVPIDLPEVYGTPERLAKMANVHPDLTVILPHLGGYRMWGEVWKFLIPPPENVYFDSSYVSNRLSPEKTKYLIEEIGADRVLFGTDYPWGDQAEELKFMESLDMDNSDLQMILEGNSRRLLDI